MIMMIVGVYRPLSKPLVILGQANFVGFAKG